MHPARLRRINLHHYLCVELFGYLTHPEIPTADPNLKVADVGTGTGSVFSVTPKNI